MTTRTGHETAPPGGPALGTNTGKWRRAVGRRASQRTEYLRAEAACLESRGYRVNVKENRSD